MEWCVGTASGTAASVPREGRARLPTVMGFRRILRWMWVSAHKWGGANRRARQRLDRSRAGVLMYHRVLPLTDAERGTVESGMYVTPKTFRQHLAWLAACFRVLPVHEIASRLEQGRPLPSGARAITSDDVSRTRGEFLYRVAGSA